MSRWELRDPGSSTGEVFCSLWRACGGCLGAGFDSSQAFVGNQLNWCFKGEKEQLHGVLLRVLPCDIPTGKLSEGKSVYFEVAVRFEPADQQTETHFSYQKNVKALKMKPYRRLVGSKS